MVSPQSPFAGVPAPLVELANGLADFVEKVIGIRPDFSPETLSLVDHYAAQVQKEVDGRPELIDLTAQGLGAYFGEVVRRSEGAFWRVPSPNFHDWALCGTTAFVMINPIGVGYDALLRRTDHSGPSSQLKLATEDRKAVSERLDLLPPLREEDYYTLCTRHEAMQIVMEAVRAQAETRGYTDMVYTDEDYGGDLKTL